MGIKKSSSRTREEQRSKDPRENIFVNCTLSQKIFKERRNTVLGRFWVKKN